MKFTKGEEQLFLEIVYLLQNNDSNAVSRPKREMEKLFPHRVYEARAEGGGGQPVYSLKPINNFEEEKRSRELKLGSKGREPISDALIAEIKKMRLEGHAMRRIARVLEVGRGTVWKYSNEW